MKKKKILIELEMTSSVQESLEKFLAKNSVSYRFFSKKKFLIYNLNFDKLIDNINSKSKNLFLLKKLMNKMGLSVEETQSGFDVNLINDGGLETLEYLAKSNSFMKIEEESNATAITQQVVEKKTMAVE